MTLVIPKLNTIDILTFGRKRQSLEQFQEYLDQNYITDEDYIAREIGHIDKVLGKGTFGKIYQLSDDSVVKITASPGEALCVQELFNLQENNWKKYEKYFPKIYSYGFINPEEKVTFSDIKDFIYCISTQTYPYKIRNYFNLKYSLAKDKFGEKDIIGWKRREECSQRNNLLLFLPIFWYQREPLDNVLVSGKEIEEKRDAIKSMFNISLMDVHADNWGIRPSTGEIIFRYLVCSSPNFKVLSGSEQWKIKSSGSNKEEASNLIDIEQLSKDAKHLLLEKYNNLGFFINNIFKETNIIADITEEDNFLLIHNLNRILKYSPAQSPSGKDTFWWESYGKKKRVSNNFNTLEDAIAWKVDELTKELNQESDDDLLIQLGI